MIPAPTALPRRLALLFVLAATLAMLIAVASFSAVTVRSASADVISTTIAPGSMTVGDRIALTIVIDHDNAVNIDAPSFGADFGGLEPTAVAPPTNDQRGDRTRTTLGYTLVAFKPGDYTIPPLEIRWRTTDGASGTVASESRAVHVASVLAPGESDLRPLKPQIELDDPAPPPIMPVLFVALFAVLTAFGYSLVARAINMRPVAVPAPGQELPATPAHVRARADLEGIAGTTDDLRAYYAAIASTIRRYLSERFGFAAYAMTRRELERSAAEAGIDRWPARLTANLLEQCDAVLFAQFRPAEERVAADLTAAYEIIDLTTDDERSAGTIRDS